MKLFFAVVLSFFVAQQSNASLLEVTDLAGRKISIEAPVSKFVVSEGRYLTALSILRPENPVQGIVGMMTTMGWTHPVLDKKLKAKFPEAREIPLFGSRSADSVSVEKIIDLKPEVAIFGLSDHGPNAKNRELMQQLDAAGITVVFIDFRLDPLNNTIPSLRLLGQILGEEERAARYINHYEKRLAMVRQRVDNVENRPTVFLQVHAGRRACCWGMADGMLGPFVEVAGGKNIADAVAPGPTALHTSEFLLNENPDVWIGTASGTLGEFKVGSLPVAMGAGMTTEMAVKSLSGYLAADEFQAMDAIRSSRAHSFWHNFYNSPFNIVVLEAFAKWIHPDRFQDVDPQQSLIDIYDEFMPFGVDGEYFATYRHDAN
ncbi:Fe3+-hydroxamate ABC transporter substrate-binding protein [Kiloniella spongiae]|uniref:Fe3+-hydroxamate ABC transporter substrate-binding protein n=1 Tax=Kiloniella spongiae TaxID=1489064 RepID=A0A0H2MBC8_9PROT|nr:ABC transporter substrate-binding protein [Kiloniella spongiae]KLN59864.1 Fe3+-hydroxamate ABC transporter substrate-binding protein [Kiloniella spongiae]